MQTGTGASPQAANISTVGLVTGGGSVNISASGNVAFNGGLVTVNNSPGSDGAVNIIAGGNVVIGSIDSATATTTLTSNGGSISGGTIVAGTLTGSSYGSTTLTSSGNSINTLGSFTASAFSLNVANAIALGNAFTLNLPSPPPLGQTYTLINAGSVSDMFTPAKVTGLSAGQRANFSYPAGQVILTIDDVIFANGFE